MTPRQRTWLWFLLAYASPFIAAALTASVFAIAWHFTAPGVPTELALQANRMLAALGACVLIFAPHPRAAFRIPLATAWAVLAYYIAEAFSMTAIRFIAHALNPS